MNNTSAYKFHKPEENNLRILIAEDDLTARSMLSGVLKKWGYTPVVVKDGQAAWEVLQQPDSPRLVILDWMMPGMDGLEVIRLTRARITEQPSYIILLTSKDEKGDILSGLETGANDYIKKPFDLEELYARIRVGQRTLELQTSLYETQQTLAHLATHDPLTGILNRRAILDQLAKEIARAQRSQGNEGTSSAFPSRSGNSRPCLRCIARAVSSCRGELSIPTERAPRRANQALTYAVPQPSSITSRPDSSSGSRRSSDSGTPQMPQLGSPAAQFRSAEAT